MNHVAITIC